MKKVLFAFLLLPLLNMAQQNVLNSTRVFPKVDKNPEFEKALATHAQKFHSGTWKWRVFEINSGPDNGGYQITEGPVSWEEIEKRGDLGAEHMADWNKNITPLLKDGGTSNYTVFQEELSTVALTDYSEWISISRLTVNPGYMDVLRGWVAKMKPVWEDRKETMAVYSVSSSGPNGLALVTRYKQGLKERATGFRPPFRDSYEKINGRDSWKTDYLEPLRTAVKEGYAELLRFRADLSSK